MRRDAQPCTVSQLNQYIKTLMDRDGVLSGVLVRGELSNYKMYPSGHHYFTLKDENGALRCVMFKREAGRLRFRPENGMQAVAFGRVTVFPRDGQYQLYCEELTPDGVGDLHMAFEQRKEKLYREGLFDPAHKKPIPPCPETVALITSGAGAAVRDMIRILGARWPLTKVKVLPVRVQGEEAPPELVGALRYANRWKVADLIIIGRGGGSMEDLWAFNDERVARAIYESELPVISAVGHEPDVTIADFVADLRAATPSNGAELAVPDQNDVYAALRQKEIRLIQRMEIQLKQARAGLDRCRNSRVLRDPMTPIQDKRLLLDFGQRRLSAALSAALSADRERFARTAAALDALSPLKVLGRGYSMVRDGQGHVLTSVEQAPKGTEVTLRLSDGELDCTVREQRRMKSAERKRR